MKKFVFCSLIVFLSLYSKNDSLIRQKRIHPSNRMGFLSHKQLQRNNNRLLLQQIKKWAMLKALENNSTFLGDRPSQVQAASNKAFAQNKSAGKSDWLYNGAWPYYGLMSIDDEVLLERIVAEKPEKQDVYIVDVGCAQGGWGKHAARVLGSEEYKNSGKRFHIFSLTGGIECDEQIIQQDNVTIYQFNQFKIENINEELEKRGFELKDKVDLIVSHWALRHLVDPWGTLKRMYGLLSPDKGKLFSNGFLFKYSDDEEIQAFPDDNEILLASNNSSATVLYGNNRVCRDCGHFLLMRTTPKELEIPLEYEGKTHYIGDGYQNASSLATVFHKAAFLKNTFDRAYVSDYMQGQRLYCDSADAQCKNLYNYLASEGFFADALDA